MKSTQSHKTFNTNDFIMKNTQNPATFKSNDFVMKDTQNLQKVNLNKLHLNKDQKIMTSELDKYEMKSSKRAYDKFEEIDIGGGQDINRGTYETHHDGTYKNTFNLEQIADKNEKRLEYLEQMGNRQKASGLQDKFVESKG